MALVIDAVDDFIVYSRRGGKRAAQRKALNREYKARSRKTQNTYRRDREHYSNRTVDLGYWINVERIEDTDVVSDDLDDDRLYDWWCDKCWGWHDNFVQDCRDHRSSCAVCYDPDCWGYCDYDTYDELASLDLVDVI